MNWTPWVRSLTQVPLAWTNSPAVIVAAAPTTVTRSRWPRTFTRSTQNPFSGLWNVTRSTKPARASCVDASAVPLPIPPTLPPWWAERYSALAYVAASVGQARELNDSKALTVMLSKLG